MRTPRAFEDVSSVVGMVEQWLTEGQQMTDSGSTPKTTLNDIFG
jgi:hypothetical protein